MSVAFQITAEGPDFDTALANLNTIVNTLTQNADHARTHTARDGRSHPAVIGGITIGSISIEDDEHMEGRMRLRRVGAPHPAFERHGE